MGAPAGKGELTALAAARRGEQAMGAAARRIDQAVGAAAGRKEQAMGDFSEIEGCTNFNYAAFYYDRQHELKRVTKGYCLCHYLIYNLIYSSASVTYFTATKKIATKVQS